MLAIPVLEIRGRLAVQPGPASDAVSAARALAVSGFRIVHVVDLDAGSGNDANTSLIDNLIRDGALEVQVEGAIDSAEQVQRFIDGGASRVVLGSRALAEPDWLAGTVDLFPGAVIVGATVHERRVGLRGWPRRLPVDVLDLVGELAGLDLGGILVSPARAEGILDNRDLALLEDIAEASEAPVFASGGVRCMNDLRALEHRGVAAVLLGAAPYSGELDARAIAQEFVD